MADLIEKTLFAAADKMRGAMDPGEYKHVGFGYIKPEFSCYMGCPRKRTDFAIARTDRHGLFQLTLRLLCLTSQGGGVHKLRNRTRDSNGYRHEPDHQLLQIH